MTTSDRCATAHPDDPTPCEGLQDAVKLMDLFNGLLPGCVHHAARMYASMTAPHVYPGNDDAAGDDAALEVYYRARTIRPYPWLAEKAEHDGGGPS